MLTISELADSCRRDATAVVNRHQKHASVRLYAVLAKTMELCERCIYSSDDARELDRLILSRVAGERNRTFIEHGSDIYTRACRYVFGGEDDGNRANASRYAHCLREAAKLQIRSDRLLERLKHDGGVNALFLRRPVEARTVTTKCLRLTESITLPKSGIFVLKLERTVENTFRPLAAQEGVR